MRSSTYNRDLEDNHNARNWTDEWENTRGGFNPNVFKGLDQGTIDRLQAIKLGPAGIGYGATKYDSDHEGFWRDGPSFERDDEDDEILYNHTVGITLPKNRGNWQDAAYAMGLGTVSNKDDLLKLVDRTEAIQKEQGNFLEDGWQAKDLSFYRDQPQQQQPEQTDTTPSDVQPEVVTETQPAVVEQAPVVKEPIEGVDYMTPDMQDAYDRIQAYNSGFSADKWIAETSEPDTDPQQLAQATADKYKFEIQQKLKPTEDSIVNALNTAIPNKLGVFAG